MTQPSPNTPPRTRAERPRIRTSSASSSRAPSSASSSGAAISIMGDEAQGYTTTTGRALHRRARCLPRHRPGRCARDPPRPLAPVATSRDPGGRRRLGTPGAARRRARGRARRHRSCAVSRRCSSPTSAPTSSASTGPVSPRSRCRSHPRPTCSDADAPPSASTSSTPTASRPRSPSSSAPTCSWRVTAPASPSGSVWPGRLPRPQPAGSSTGRMTGWGQDGRSPRRRVTTSATSPPPRAARHRPRRWTAPGAGQPRRATSAAARSTLVVGSSPLCSRRARAAAARSSTPPSSTARPTSPRSSSASSRPACGPTAAAPTLLDTGAPFYDVYETSDGGWLAVGPLEPTFYAELLRLLDLTGSAPDRLDPSQWPALRALFADTFRTRTRDEWAALLEGTDACVAPVLSYAEAPAHPHPRSPLQPTSAPRRRPAGTLAALLPHSPPRFGAPPPPRAPTTCRPRAWGIDDVDASSPPAPRSSHEALRRRRPTRRRPRRPRGPPRTAARGQPRDPLDRPTPVARHPRLPRGRSRAPHRRPDRGARPVRRTPRPHSSCASPEPVPSRTRTPRACCGPASSRCAVTSSRWRAAYAMPQLGRSDGPTARASPRTSRSAASTAHGGDPVDPCARRVGGAGLASGAPRARGVAPGRGARAAAALRGARRAARCAANRRGLIAAGVGDLATVSRGDGRLNHDLIPGEKGPQDACGVFGGPPPGEDVAKLTYSGSMRCSTAGRSRPASRPVTARRSIVYKDMALVITVFDETRAQLAAWPHRDRPHRATRPRRLHVGERPADARRRRPAARWPSRTTATSSTPSSSRLSWTSTSAGTRIHRRARPRQHLRHCARHDACSPPDEDRTPRAGRPRAAPQAQGRLLLRLHGRDDVVCRPRPLGRATPLALGRLERGWVVASETDALQTIGAARHPRGRAR